MLVPKILEPFETESGKQTIRYEIENLTLLPQEAQTIALALHELANNASRHGALNSPGGSVDLTIKLDSAGGSDRVLRLNWVERGGQQPVSAPETGGFGSIMLERLLARQHGGESRFDWDPKGLKFEAILPLANQEDVETGKKY
ncbi:MAG: sensor histidine kinase [Anderseniella sp.]|nr:sensor histidine kinase [Anderseniella sp.]